MQIDGLKLSGNGKIIDGKIIDNRIMGDRIIELITWGDNGAYGKKLGLSYMGETCFWNWLGVSC